MSLHPSPPVTLFTNDFTGVNTIPASGLGVGDHMQTLGYTKFMCYCKCDRDAQVFIQMSEDHSNWYTVADKEWTDILSEHDNATVGVADSTITPSSQLHSTLINNTHATQNVLVSFDGGTTYITIEPNLSLSIPDNSYDYIIKGSGAGTTYESIINYYLWGKMVKASSNIVFPISVPASTYIRVQVLNLDSANALSAEIDIKAME